MTVTEADAQLEEAIGVWLDARIAANERPCVACSEHERGAASVRRTLTAVLGISPTAPWDRIIAATRLAVGSGDRPRYWPGPETGAIPLWDGPDAWQAEYVRQQEAQP